MDLSLAMVLSLERPIRELSVGGATRAVAASGAIGSQTGGRRRLERPRNCSQINVQFGFLK